MNGKSQVDFESVSPGTRVRIETPTLYQVGTYRSNIPIMAYMSRGSTMQQRMAYIAETVVMEAGGKMQEFARFYGSDMEGENEFLVLTRDILGSEII
jgi:hypothetical protein